VNIQRAGDVLTRTMHLWEIDHDYYCNDANYYSRDSTMEYASFEAFMEEWDGAPAGSYDLLFRWDWKAETDEDSDELSEAGKAGKGVLKLYWMGQRKGLFKVSLVDVEGTDEERVRVWLQQHLEHMVKLWAPFGVEATAP